MMAGAYGLTSCPSALVHESELSHRSGAQYGFMLERSHHGDKNTALRAEKQAARCIVRKEGFYAFVNKRNLYYK